MHSPITFWAQGYGAWADFEGDVNAAGAKRTLGGFLTGMDAIVAESWRGGLALGYARSDVSVNARLSSADVSTFQLAAYGSGEIDHFAVRGGAVWSRSEIDTSRAVLFPGFIERVEASYDADTGQVVGEVALPLRHFGVAYEPFGGLAWVGVDPDAFTETGGNAALASSGASQSVGYLTLGGRAATTVLLYDTRVTPRGSVAWLHAFGDITPAEALAFATFGQSFVVSGVPLAKDSALLDAGLDVHLARDATVALSYAGQFARTVRDNAVTGRLDWRF
jgi:outer membrane autotransporter protein